MAYEENIYARIVNGDVSKDEIDHLKKTGEWDEINKILDVSAKLKLPDFNKDEQFKKLTHQKSMRNKVFPIKRKMFLSIAASLVMLIAALFIFNNIDGITTVKSGLAENITHTLPDNSIVVLNDGSQIRFNEKKWKGSRKVNLKGEAYFEVAKGADFIVETSKGKVQVLGTKFNVKDRDNMFFIECFEGRVEVKSESNDSSVILNRNNSVLFLDGRYESIQNISNQLPDWKMNVSRFKDTETTFVFKEMERQFAIDINNKAAVQQFSGIFSHSDIEKALDDVCRPLGLKYKLSSNNKSIEITD